MRACPRVLLAVSWAALGCGPADQSAPGRSSGAAEAASAAAPAAAGARDGSPWDLVYEHVLGGNQDLYLAPAGGGLPRRLTDHPAVDGLPRFTPDGAHVLFTSERAGNWQIWEVPVAGGSARRVRTNPHTEWQIDVSPNGRELAFLSNQEGAEHLWVMDRKTGAQRALVRHGRKSILGNPNWSPQGDRIVFSSNWKVGHHIYVLDVASGEERRISELRAGGCEPRFNRDGTKVLYVRRGHLGGDRSRLVEHDLGSGQQKILVDWPALNYDGVYSPDGAEVAFASNITGEYAIYRQRLSDGKSWRVTQGGGPARYPEYRPK